MTEVSKCPNLDANAPSPVPREESERLVRRCGIASRSLSADLGQNWHAADHAGKAFGRYRFFFARGFEAFMTPHPGRQTAQFVVLRLTVGTRRPIGQRIVADTNRELVAEAREKQSIR